MDNWEGQNFIMTDTTPAETSAEHEASHEAEYQGFYSADFDNGNKKKKKREKKPRRPMEITRKTFVLTLIICMVFTAALSMGGMYAFSKYAGWGGAASDAATNYTLTSSEDTLTYESIIAKNENAVVSIATESVANDSWMQNYVTQGAGSGVIVQSDGYIMTCNHVIEGASKITVTLKDGTEYDATIVGADEDNDIAIIKVNATGLTAATYGDSSSIVVGSAVVVIGNPLGSLGGTATTGIISALDRELTIDNRTMNLLQTDASINPGNSGGGLFDAAGNLVGIVVAKSSGSDVEGLGFAIPINTAAEIGKNIIENGGNVSSKSVSSDAAIGITVTDVSSSEAAQAGLSNAGVYITQVTSSEAQSAGLRAGDMIYQVGSTRINSTSDLSTALSGHSPGDEVAIVVVRNNRTVNVTTTLVEATN